MIKLSSLFVLALYTVATGSYHEVEATHLFSPPFYFFSRYLNDDINTAATDEILKIFVSPEDSSIRIKKDTEHIVVYNLQWKNETVKSDTCKDDARLRIYLGMMHDDEGDKSWEKGTCVDVIGLEPNAHSIPINCTDENFNLTFHGNDHGKTELVIANVTKSPTWDSITENVESSKANVKVAVYLSDGINTFNDVIGWVYFVAWSVSFYPQVWINFRRKSVVGLNFDFLSLNVVGFTLYSCYNCGLYFNKEIQSMYFDENDTQNVPVKTNDVVFGLHAVFACIVTIIQCFIYERGGQRVSIPCIGALVGIFLFIISTSISAGVDAISWLEFLTWASYVKLGITIVKYMPQAYMNFRRKSTEGWSIGNVLLDFTGGSLSMLQMIMDSYNLDDWSSFFGDFTKFGLGLFSVLFDILFILQHYVCYRNAIPQDSHVVPTNFESLPNQEESDSRGNGHENLAYVANEVAGVASTAVDDKRD